MCSFFLCWVYLCYYFHLEGSPTSSLHIYIFPFFLNSTQVTYPQRSLIQVQNFLAFVDLAPSWIPVDTLFYFILCTELYLFSLICITGHWLLTVVFCFLLCSAWVSESMNARVGGECRDHLCQFPYWKEETHLLIEKFIHGPLIFLKHIQCPLSWLYIYLKCCWLSVCVSLADGSGLPLELSKSPPSRTAV